MSGVADSSSTFTCYDCENEDCLGQQLKYHCKDALTCFDFSITHTDGKKEIKKGCLQDLSAIDFVCKTTQRFSSKPSSGNFSGSCCKGNLCNNQTYPSYLLASSSLTGVYNILANLSGYIYLFAILVIIAILLCILVWIRKKASRNSKSKCQINDEIMPNHLDKVQSLPIDAFDDSDTSGSGSGLPLLAQRTLSKEIQLETCFYKGRINEVWRGSWKGCKVAVKVFYSRDEAAWLREQEIYKTLTNHENILDYISSDCASKNYCTQLWLITNYYELGSLYDYLNVHALRKDQCLSILKNAISGISFLHNEYISESGRKPGIAHRDIKSRNILMKNDYNVCIADFGLAVTYTRKTNELINGEKYKVGTKRYMAPEILNDTFKPGYFSSYTSADIYSFALVMWETVKRCRNDAGIAEDYSLPFGEVVPIDPDFEDMRKIVCDDGQRPYISPRIFSDPVLSNVAKIFQECWAANPSVRLTSSRVNWSLEKLIGSYPLHENKRFKNYLLIRQADKGSVLQNVEQEKNSSLLILPRD